jgi:uncharacterized repeat protein (TIGR01451 family)
MAQIKSAGGFSNGNSSGQEFYVTCYSLAGGVGSSDAAQDIFVYYSADGSTYTTSSSPTLATPTATTTALTASPNPVATGSTVTLTAVETPAAAGSVQFEEGGSDIGLSVPVNSSGVATTTTTFTTQGPYGLSAVFTPTDATAYDGSTGTYSLTVTAPPPPAPILNVGKSEPTPGDGVAVTAGQSAPIEYNFTVSNTGTVDATNVVINDPIPGGSLYVANSASCGSTCVASFANNTVTFILSDVVADATDVFFDFEVSVNASDANGSTITNQASFTDVNTPNCVAGPTTGTCLTNQISNPVVAPIINVVKSEPTPGNGVAVTAGNEFLYHLELTNTGGADATNVVVNDPIPAGTIYVAGSATPPCALASTGDAVTCTLPDVLAGADDVFGFDVIVNADAFGRISNQAAFTDVNTPNCTPGQTPGTCLTNTMSNPVVSPTSTTVAGATATYSPSNQSVTLSATVTSTSSTVNEGTVTFSLLNSSANPIGFPVTSSTVTGGSASVSFTLPGGTAVGSYTIDATYHPGPDFLTSSGVGTLLVIPPADSDLAFSQPPNITTNAAGASGATVTYNVSSYVSDPDDSTVSATVACTPKSGSTFGIGTTKVTCTATDADDSNSPVSASFNVIVVGAPGQVAALKASVQGVGSGTSLSDKLVQVQADLAANSKVGACGVLMGFINQVNATLTKKAAAPLVASAKQIEAVLGC